MVAAAEKWFQAGRVRVPTKQRIRKRPEPESVAPAPTVADSSSSPAVIPLAAASPDVVLASGGDTQPQPPPDKSYKPRMIYHVTGEKGWLLEFTKAYQNVFACVLQDSVAKLERQFGTWPLWIRCEALFCCCFLL